MPAGGLRGGYPAALLPAWAPAALVVGLCAGACTGGDATAPTPPTAPAPLTETVTVAYRDVASGDAVDGTVTYTDPSGNGATAATGSTITILQGTRLAIDAPGYSRKETGAGSRVDGAYWGIPAALQAAVDRARGNGGLQRPGLDRSFDVVLDRLTFTAAQRDAVRAALEAAAVTVTAGRYRWTFRVADDPSPRTGTYAVMVAGAVTFAPFLNGDQIEGGKTGIDPTSPQLERAARLAAARMVGFKADDYDEDPAVFLAMTRLPIGNRVPNADP